VLRRFSLCLSFGLSVYVPVRLRLRPAGQTQLSVLLESFHKLVVSNASIAECTMELVEQENVKGVLLPALAPPA
jgi:hypothetical protein